MRRPTALFLALMLAMTLCLGVASAESDYDAFNTFIKDALDSGSDLLYSAEEQPAGYVLYQLIYEAKDGRMGDIYLYLSAYPHGVLVQGSYYEDVPEERVDSVALFMNMANSDILGMKYYVFPDSGTVLYELYLPMDTENLGEYERELLLEVIDMMVYDLDYDVEYFAAIIDGESAENVYAMYNADLYGE